jgi:hypothetical protein
MHRERVTHKSVLVEGEEAMRSTDLVGRTESETVSTTTMVKIFWSAKKDGTTTILSLRLDPYTCDFAVLSLAFVSCGLHHLWQ